MLGSMRRVLLILALTHGFAPAPAPRGLPPLHMKKPSPALEVGPLPGLSQTNYNVLIGVTALGVAAPALLFASNVVLPEMTKAKPPAKKPVAGAKAPAGAATADAKFSLPTLPRSKSKSTVDAAAKKEAAAKAKADAAAAAEKKKEAAAKAKAEKAAAAAEKKAQAAAAAAAKKEAAAKAKAEKVPPARESRGLPSE